MPTIGNLIDLGFILSVHCIDCDHHQTADLEQIVAKYGREVRYVSGLRVKCSRCNSENAWTSVHPPEPPSRLE